MFSIIKIVLMVIGIVVVLAALSPVIQSVLPNTASDVPGAIQSDMERIGSVIEEQAGQAIDTVAGGVEGAASTVTGGVNDTFSAVTDIIP